MAGSVVAAAAPPRSRAKVMKSVRFVGLERREDSARTHRRSLGCIRCAGTQGRRLTCRRTARKYRGASAASKPTGRRGS
eukprot:3308369-Pleurochrysis_carterae.AAC.2